MRGGGGGEHGDLRCCGVDDFLDAVMRCLKCQFAVLRGSEILRCAMVTVFRRPFLEVMRCSLTFFAVLRCSPLPATPMSPSLNI